MTLSQMSTVFGLRNLRAGVSPTKVNRHIACEVVLKFVVNEEAHEGAKHTLILQRRTCHK